VIPLLPFLSKFRKSRFRRNREIKGMPSLGTGVQFVSFSS
jgi:hypothetical protein